MSELFLLALVAATSLLAYALGRWGVGFPASLRPGLRRTTETVGVAVVFYTVNVMITVAGTLALRALGLFVSLYYATDYVLIILSFLQALVFQNWRGRGRGQGEE